MTDRHAEIKASYKQLGGSFASFYDGMITYTKPAGKLFNRAIWGFNEKTTEQWINGALSGVPEGFSGKLLEVPIGTGVITMPMYRTLPEADITCLDYSPDMMKNAQKRAEAMEISNITFMQGDVGDLPFADESFDIVLSLNGFHAFPDKEAAYRETYRVLKPGGLPSADLSDRDREDGAATVDVPFKPRNPVPAEARRRQIAEGYSHHRFGRLD